MSTEKPEMTSEEKAIAFRTERIKLLKEGEIPLISKTGPKVVFHSCPTGHDGPLDMHKLMDGPTAFSPLSLETGGIYRRINFDGYVSYVSLAEQTRNDRRARAPETAYSYALLFRNRIVEAIDESDSFFERFRRRDGGEEEDFVRGVLLERGLALHLIEYLALQKSFGAKPPFTVLLSFLDLQGRHMYYDEHSYSRYPAPSPIDRNEMHFPPISVESCDSLEDAYRILRPSFDLLWQASDWPFSLNFENDGTRKKDR